MKTDQLFPLAGGSYRRINGALVRDDDAAADQASAPADAGEAATERKTPSTGLFGRKHRQE